MCQEVVKRRTAADEVVQMEKQPSPQRFAQGAPKKARRSRLAVAGVLSAAVAALLLADLWLFEGAGGLSTCSSGVPGEAAGSMPHIALEVAVCLAVFGAVLALKGLPPRRAAAGGCRPEAAGAPRLQLRPRPAAGSIEAAAQENDAAAAAAALRAQQAAGHPVSPQQFCLVARALARAGDLEAAEGLLREMKAKSITPSACVFNAIMDACAKANLPDACEAHFKELLAAGLQPCLFTFSALVHARARRGEVAAAEAWFKRMTLEGIQPDAVICNSFIHAYSVHRDILGAERWLLRLRDLGLETNVASYSSVIDACAKAGDLQRAEHWFQRLEEEGQVPNVVTFSTMIDACAKVGALDSAERWHERMLAAGVRPNAHSFGAMVNACAKSTSPRAAQAAESWLERAEAAGVVRDVVIYSSGVDACAKAGDAERAMRIFRRGQANGYKPHIMAYCALARAFAHRGDWIKVENIGKEMDAAGVSRNEFFVYAQMVGYALAKPRQQDRAERCLREALAAGVAINDHIAGALARALGRRRATELMQELCGGRPVPAALAARRPERTAQRSAAARLAEAER